MLKRNLSSVAMSIAEVVIGFLLLVNPVAFTSGITVAFGVVLMFMGIGTIIKYFCTAPEEAEQMALDGDQRGNLHCLRHHSYH